MTELEAALSARVAFLEAESVSLKEAARVAVEAAHAEAEVERRHANELAEAVGGVEPAQQIIAQHRLRRAHQRRKELSEQLQQTERLITELLAIECPAHDALRVDSRIDGIDRVLDGVSP